MNTLKIFFLYSILVLALISFICSYLVTVGDVYHYFSRPKINSKFDYFNFSNGEGKLILMWTPHWGISGTYGWDVNNNSFDNCPVKCDVTSEKTLLEKSDVLMFSANWDVYFQAPVPKIRRVDQLYVYYWHESPGYSYLPLYSWKNFFNLTMTYRRDADIYNPYGRFLPLQNGENQIIETIEDVKDKKLVAWLVSSCTSLSEREDLVEKLQKYVNVDIYGECGMSCPSNESCMGFLGRNYKFYLSLENSLCMDYITEKFYNPYAYGFVPITYAVGVDRIAPKNSYIDFLNFTNVKELADKLKYLDNHTEEYLKYFEWKSKYKVHNYFENEMCNLCQVVSKFDKRNQSMYKSYDIKEWWHGTYENPICIHNPSYYVQLKEILDFIF